jgi:hypothetical protein
LVFVQNEIDDDVIHRKLRNKRTATTAVQHFGFRSSTPPPARRWRPLVAAVPQVSMGVTFGFCYWPILKRSRLSLLRTGAAGKWPRSKALDPALPFGSRSTNDCRGKSFFFRNEAARRLDPQPIQTSKDARCHNLAPIWTAPPRGGAKDNGNLSPSKFD